MNYIEDAFDTSVWEAIRYSEKPYIYGSCHGNAVVIQNRFVPLKKNAHFTGDAVIYDDGRLEPVECRTNTVVEPLSARRLFKLDDAFVHTIRKMSLIQGVTITVTSDYIFARSSDNGFRLWLRLDESEINKLSKTNIDFTGWISADQILLIIDTAGIQATSGELYLSAEEASDGKSNPYLYIDHGNILWRNTFAKMYDDFKYTEPSRLSETFVPMVHDEFSLFVTDGKHKIYRERYEALCLLSDEIFIHGMHLYSKSGRVNAIANLC